MDAISGNGKRARRRGLVDHLRRGSGIVVDARLPPGAQPGTTELELGLTRGLPDHRGYRQSLASEADHDADRSPVTDLRARRGLLLHDAIDRDAGVVPQLSDLEREAERERLRQGLLAPATDPVGDLDEV